MANADIEKVDIFMPLYPADYLADTMDLTTEEHGAYMLLLLALWRGRGEIDAAPARLAATAKISPKRWPAFWRVLSRFFIERNGKLQQRRLSREIEKAIVRRQKAMDSGRRGGLAKAARVARNSLPGSPEAGQPDPNGVAIANGVADGVANPLVKPSSSPSPSLVSVSPRAPARDPGGTEPEPGPGAMKAHELTEMFGRIRSEVFPNVLPWAGVPISPQKPAIMAASITAETASDVEPTMRLFLRQAAAGQHPRAADITKSPGFAFACWCQQFHELREEIHGKAPPVPVPITPPRKQRDVSVGYAPPPAEGTVYPAGKVRL